MKQEYLDILSLLRPIDNDFMKVIFKDQRCVDLLVQIIFDHHFSIRKFIIGDEHKNIDGRSVTMDIVIYTHEGVIINIELEKSIENASPLRARYHACILDSSLSYPGEKWNELPEIYVVFICEKDVFQDQELVDHIQRYRSNRKVFEDKVHIFYINAGIEDESPVGMLMHDLMCSDPDQMYYEVLRKRVSYFKKQEGGKKTMCEALERLVLKERQEAERIGREEGEKVGIERGKLKTIVMILMQKFPGHSFEWVKKCNKEQIDKIVNNIFLDISYNDFYALIFS